MKHPPTILITGAAGNLGGLLARHLIPGGHPRRLMYHLKPLPADIARASNVTCVQADLADPRTLPGALSGADVVVHFAGVLFAPRPERFLDEACRAWGYPRPHRIPLWLVYSAASLCELFALIAGTPSPLTRDFIRIGRVSHWGDTRRAREELIPELEHRTLATGLSTL